MEVPPAKGLELHGVYSCNGWNGVTSNGLKGDCTIDDSVVCVRTSLFSCLMKTTRLEVDCFFNNLQWGALWVLVLLRH